MAVGNSGDVMHCNGAYKVLPDALTCLFKITKAKVLGVVKTLREREKKLYKEIIKKTLCRETSSLIFGLRLEMCIETFNGGVEVLHCFI